MMRALLFSLGFGTYSFATLVIMQHYTEAKKLSKPLLLFVLLMALNFAVRAWMYFEWLSATLWIEALRQTQYRSLRLMSYILAGVSMNTFLLTCHCFSVGLPPVVSLVISFLFVALSLGLLARMVRCKRRFR